MGGLHWRKSNASGTGNCVEVAFSDGRVHVRDSKDPDCLELEFTADEWQAFLDECTERNRGVL